MGQIAARLRPTEGSDLNDEQVEEIHMLTSLPASEIHRIRRKYQTLATTEDMSKEEFFAIPGIAVNPLRDQVFRLFELTSEARIPFGEFARFVAIYSFHSTQDTKLRESFRIHDFDGDGKISRQDLQQYLRLTYHSAMDESESSEEAAKLHDQTLDTVISRILEEASSDPTMEFLNYEDYIKVVQPTDFESRLIFPF